MLIIHIILIINTNIKIRISTDISISSGIFTNNSACRTFFRLPRFVGRVRVQDQVSKPFWCSVDLFLCDLAHSSI